MESQCLDISSQQRQQRMASFMRGLESEPESFETSQSQNALSRHNSVSGSQSINALQSRKTPARMSTQGTSSSNAKTQPLTQGAADEYLRRQMAPEPLDEEFSPEMPRIQPMSESKRFQTPGTVARKEDNEYDSPSLPQNPLLGFGDGPGAMGLSQIFANTQLPTSPNAHGETSDPMSEQPTPALYYATTRQIPVNLSSPTGPRKSYTARKLQSNRDTAGRERGTQALEHIREATVDEDSDGDEEHVRPSKRARLMNGAESQLVEPDDIEDDEEAQTQLAASRILKRNPINIIATPDNQFQNVKHGGVTKQNQEVVAVADSQQSPSEKATMYGLRETSPVRRENSMNISPDRYRDAIEESSLVPPPPLSSSYRSTSPSQSHRIRGRTESDLNDNIDKTVVLNNQSSPPRIGLEPMETHPSASQSGSQDTDKENRNPAFATSGEGSSHSRVRHLENGERFEPQIGQSSGAITFQTARSQGQESGSNQSTPSMPANGRVRTLTEIAAEAEPLQAVDESLLDIRLLNTQDSHYQNLIRSSDSSPVGPAKKRRRTTRPEESPRKQLAATALQNSSPLRPPRLIPAPEIHQSTKNVEMVDIASSPLTTPPPQASDGEEDSESEHSSDGDNENDQMDERPDDFDIPLMSPPKKFKQATYTRKTAVIQKVNKGRQTKKTKPTANASNTSRNAKTQVRPPSAKKHMPQLDIVTDRDTPRTPDPPTKAAVAQTEDAAQETVPSTDLTHPYRVLAKFRGGTNAFYPATVVLGLPSSSATPSRLKIRFDDGTVDILDTNHVRSLSLRRGDPLKVDLPKMRTKNYIVCGFKDRLPPPSPRHNEAATAPDGDLDSSLVTTSGHSILVLAQRSRESSGDSQFLADVETFDVPLSSIYVTPANLSKFDDRPYIHKVQTLTAQPSAPPMTPILNVASTTVSPVSGRGRARSKAVPINFSVKSPSNQPSSAPIEAKNALGSDGLFSNMCFALSYTNESEKVAVAKLIRQKGGTILQTGFDELFEPSSAATPTLKPIPGAEDIGFVALLADRHSRKPKFMQALALGIPCLSGAWASKCVQENRFCDWQRYLLAAGESRELGGAVISRRLEYEGNTPFLSMLRQSNMVDGGLFFVGGKKGAKRETYWFLVRAMAGLGSGQLKWVEKVDDVDVNPENVVVFVGDGHSKEARISLTKKSKGRAENITIVEDEDVLQSLIMGTFDAE